MTRLFEPVYLDPSILTRPFRPIYVNPSFWTHLFGPYILYGQWPVSQSWLNDQGIKTLKHTTQPSQRVSTVFIIINPNISSPPGSSSGKLQKSWCGRVSVFRGWTCRRCLRQPKRHWHRFLLKAIMVWCYAVRRGVVWWVWSFVV